MPETLVFVAALLAVVLWGYSIFQVIQLLTKKSALPGAVFAGLAVIPAAYFPSCLLHREAAGMDPDVYDFLTGVISGFITLGWVVFIASGLAILGCVGLRLRVR